MIGLIQGDTRSLGNGSFDTEAPLKCSAALSKV